MAQRVDGHAIAQSLSHQTSDAVAGRRAEGAAPARAVILVSEDHSLKIRVRDLAVLADVGINPDEIGRRQPLIVGVELTVMARNIESIDETIDYRRIAGVVETLAEVHVPLIETFARHIGTKCLSWPLVEAVRITVDKPFALTRGLAGIELTMRRTSA